MAIQKIEGLWLGSGDMKSLSPSCRFYVGDTVPLNSFGNDGDIFIISNGLSSDYMQKVGGIWISYLGQPTKMPLVDGQITPTTAFSYPITSYPYAKIEYTIRRGSGQDRKRQGVLYILSDSISSNMSYSEEQIEIGLDVNVTLSVQVSGSNINIDYISSLEGTAIELAYTIKGWK